jgi:hypothetical protein
MSEDAKAVARLQGQRVQEEARRKKKKGTLAGEMVRCLVFPMQSTGWQEEWMLNK